MKRANQETAKRKAVLLRYQAIAEEYNRHKQLDEPTTVIWLKYIYPKFFISLRTLNTVLGTPITKELNALNGKTAHKYEVHQV